MKVKFEYGSEVFSLPQNLLEYLDKASPLALRMLLTLSGDKALRDDFSKEDLSRKFAVTAKETEEALAFWERTGILTLFDEKGKKKASQTVREGVKVITGEGPVSYSGKEIETIMNSREEAASLLSSCQNLFGKVFSVTEVNKVMALLDYLGLEPAYITLLFSYCRKIDRVSVHYVEKMAYSLYEQGITGYGALEAELADREKKSGYEGKIRTIMGIGSREFTQKEKKFISLWCDLELPFEMLRMAYEVAVDNTGAPSMPYMNKVLSNWREAGYKTEEDVIRAEEEYRRKKEASVGGSFDTNEFFEAALKRSYNEALGGSK